MYVLDHLTAIYVG